MVFLIILYFACIVLTTILLVQIVRMCRAITRMKNNSPWEQIRFADICFIKKLRLALIILAAAILIVLLCLLGAKNVFFALLIFIELGPINIFLLIALHFFMKPYSKVLDEYNAHQASLQ